MRAVELINIVLADIPHSSRVLENGDVCIRMTYTVSRVLPGEQIYGLDEKEIREHATRMLDDIKHACDELKLKIQGEQNGGSTSNSKQTQSIGTLGSATAPGQTDAG